MINVVLGGVLLYTTVNGTISLVRTAANFFMGIEDSQELPPGEGLFSKVIKVKVAEDASVELGQDIWMASEIYSKLKRYVGKTYTLTRPEEAMVKALMNTIITAIQLVSTRSGEGQEQSAKDAYSVGQQAAEALALYLWQFPAVRVQ